MQRSFKIVDVFGERPLSGNPLAVVVDSEGLSTEEMLEATRWFGFSETTFLLPPTTTDADYRVRIFTLAGELPFAGHPTLGSGHVWRTITGSTESEIVQECGAGLIDLEVDGDIVSFEAPDLFNDGPVSDDDLADLALVLGIDAGDIVAARWVDNGPGWVGILMDSADAVLDLQPDFTRSPRGGKLDIGVAGMFPEGNEFRYEVRAFFSGDRGQMLEDPVTGSLNASMAQWLLGDGRVTTPYLARQGTAVGRTGRIEITGDTSSVWVGGRVFDVVSGQVDL